MMQYVFLLAFVACVSAECLGTKQRTCTDTTGGVNVTLSCVCGKYDKSTNTCPISSGCAFSAKLAGPVTNGIVMLSDARYGFRFPRPTPHYAASMEALFDALVTGPKTVNWPTVGFLTDLMYTAAPNVCPVGNCTNTGTAFRCDYNDTDKQVQSSFTLGGSDYVTGNVGTIYTSVSMTNPGYTNGSILDNKCSFTFAIRLPRSTVLNSPCYLFQEIVQQYNPRLCRYVPQIYGPSVRRILHF